MCNSSSKKMGAARDAWSKLVTDPTLDNLRDAEKAYKAAGASWKSFSGMKIPMPQKFPTEYFSSQKRSAGGQEEIDKTITTRLKTDFGPEGRFSKKKLASAA